MHPIIQSIDQQIARSQKRAKLVVLKHERRALKKQLIISVMAAAAMAFTATAAANDPCTSWQTVGEKVMVQRQGGARIRSVTEPARYMSPAMARAYGVVVAGAYEIPRYRTPGQQEWAVHKFGALVYHACRHAIR